MKLSFLGHSEFILEMENNSGRPVRILCDSWLTDHAFGDFLSRNPRVSIDTDRIPKLDAIYITHPHCDHFDPYTLIEIYKKQKPALLLPETSEFLIPLLKEHLGNPDIFIFRHGQAVRLFGINMQAFSFYTPYHTNEDDVMMLFFHNGKEIVFYEADSAVPEDPAVHETIYKIFASHEFKTRTYIATRNELEALFTSYDAKIPQHRKRDLSDYRSRREEEMQLEYIKFDDGYVEYKDIRDLNGFIRILVGQGIVFPPEINEDFLKISAPFPLAEVAAEEKKVSAAFGRKPHTFAHEPGKTFIFENGKINAREKLPEGFRVNPLPVSFDNKIVIPLEPLTSPLRHEQRDIEIQKNKIINCLNHRFLPYQLSSLEDPLQKAMSETGKGRYTIRFYFGNNREGEYADFTYSFAQTSFSADGPHNIPPQEHYFANDIEDFLDGTQDLFSNSLDRFEPGTQRRFWNMLGMPFVNSDLVYRKLEYHFRRAKEGNDISSWVLNIARNNRS